jgi:simple sugar transport system substrate-binding protein
VSEQLNVIQSFFQGNPDVNGMYAVDAGSTQGVAQTIDEAGVADRVRGGGYDLLPITLELINEGSLDFTIDQQPYLQGFLPVFGLYLQKLSGGVATPAETNTGLKFVTSDNVQVYLDTESRFEGDSDEQKIVGADAA